MAEYYACAVRRQRIPHAFSSAEFFVTFSSESSRYNDIYKIMKCYSKSKVNRADSFNKCVNSEYCISFKVQSYAVSTDIYQIIKSLRNYAIECCERFNNKLVYIIGCFLAPKCHLEAVPLVNTSK